MEKYVDPREAVLLRRAGGAVQDPHGEVSGLQVPASTQENLHAGREESKNFRVQSHHEEQEGGAEDDVVRGAKLSCKY